jgi:hypothetical protein
VIIAVSALAYLTNFSAVFVAANVRFPFKNAYPTDDFGRKGFLPVKPQGGLSFLILLGEPRFA